MKRILVEVMTSGDALKRFGRIARAAKRAKPVDPVIGVESMAELTALLSPKRMELLRHVAAHPGLSVRALALALRRDYKNVHTEVTDLEARRLLVRDASGGVTAPYDEIMIRAPLRDAA